MSKDATSGDTTPYPPVVGYSRPIGQPQGPTTGRWELLEHVRGKDVSRGRRWNEVPMWYRVLDRFGLPTLLLLGLSWGVWTVGNNVIERWDKQQKEVAAAMTRQAEATGRIVDKIDKMADDTHLVTGIILDRIGRPMPFATIGPAPEKKEDKK